MPITSRSLYAELRSRLGPVLKDKGFKRTKSGMLAFARAQGQDCLTIWFQADKYGWEQLWGSQFTLELQLDPAPAPGVGSLSRRKRYFYLLDERGREEVRSKNNAMINSLPGTLQDATVSVKDDEGRDVVIVGVREAFEPYNPGWDIWMRYYTVQDIDAWSAFISQYLDDIIERFLEDAPSAA